MWERDFVGVSNLPFSNFSQLQSNNSGAGGRWGRFLCNSSSIPQIPSKIHIQKQDGEDEVISILNLISENELNLVLKSVMDTINLFDVIQRKVFYYKLLRFFKKETLVCSQNIDLLICLPKLTCNKLAPFKLRQATDSVSDIFS